jgi:hypothetical protein
MALYPFWIRTPVPEINCSGQWTNILWTAGAQAAGPNGATLRPGQAAWVDRPLGPNEPRCLQILAAQGQVPTDQIVRGYQNLHNFRTLLLTPNLLVQIQLGTVKDGKFFGQISGIQMPWEPLIIRPAGG